MKKRFLCALLTLIMLVSLVPATALTASAAGHSTSEAAITVLKQWNGYRTNCKSDGYTGYGTPCTVKATHGEGTHTISEKQADTALRAALKDLDKAINTFASNAGLSLTQGQHDALVLFSFDNGTAWTTGTGSFRSAVVNRLTGNAFLNAIGWWNASTADDERRMVEANMYLNGAYSSVAPSRFIRVSYIAGGYVEEGEKIPTTEFSAEELAFYNTKDAKSMGIKVKDGYVIFPGVGYEGHLAQAEHRYYDTATNPVADVVPTMDNHKFMGWYSTPAGGYQVTSLTRSRELYAYWQRYDAIPDNGTPETGNVWYIKEFADQIALYNTPGGDKLIYTVKGNLTIDSEFVDETGMRWGRVYKAQKLYRNGTKVEEAAELPIVVALGSEYTYQHVWIKLGQASFNNGLNNTGVNFSTDVTVTVTNSYVRVRSEDSIYSTELRRANMGETLRIVNTSHADGFLWGQVADASGKAVGWVALMYTNYESVKNQSSTVVSQNVIGTATIVKPENGYVNLRSGAGTDNQIVGALAYKTRVPLYEVTYVNGIRWGRTDSGWFSLQYAEVEGVSVDSFNTNANVLAYSFVGDIHNTWNIHEQPSDSSALVRIKPEFVSSNRVISHLTLDNDGSTWGKIAEGWVKVSFADSSIADVTLKLARYQVVSSNLTVRENPDHASRRVDSLGKGVEFNVNVNGSQIIVVGDSVWAQAFKVGEDNPTYMGWVNLLATNVSRVDAPSAEKQETHSYSTGLKATIVNTDNVNVREYNDATYARIGSLARGTTVAVWEEEDGWYKIDSNQNGKYDYEGDGWVSAKYLNIFEDEKTTAGANGNAGTAGSASGNVETGLGVIANTYTGVNVRTGAGTGYAAAGKILAGSTVEILEVKTVGSSKWGRVTQGWICMDYVTMISKYAIAGTTTSTGTNGTTSSTTNTTASQKVIYTGKIIVDGTKVSTEPSILALNSNGEDIQKVRTVNAGTPVTVHELMVVEETVAETVGDVTTSTTTKYYWARTNDGYIKDPGTCIELDPLAEKTYTVTSYVANTDNCLRIYEVDCATKKETRTLNMYDQVSVTTLKIVDNQLWCRVEFTDEDGYNHEGYVLMKYLTNGVVSRPSTNNNTNTNNNTTNNNIVIGSSGNTANQGTNGYVNNTSGYRYTGRVIRTGSVNVRAYASQGAALTTTLKSGAALVIYETVVSEGMAWGRCDAGWVYLYYVDLQPCNNAVDAKVVYNENTIAYTDANCTAVAGTYSRMSVVDIYEQVGSMCRTDLGWVHIDNLG